jgi:hypothetical protein
MDALKLALELIAFAAAVVALLIGLDAVTTDADAATWAYASLAAYFGSVLVGHIR